MGYCVRRGLPLHTARTPFFTNTYNKGLDKNPGGKDSGMNKYAAIFIPTES